MTDIGDPFGPTMPEGYRPPTQAELDAAAALRRKRGQSRGFDRKIKPADLESQTRQLLRKLGYVYGRTETVNFAGFKNDLFGFCDGIAIGERDIWFVQTTSRPNRAAHIRKMAVGEFKIGNGSPTPCFDAASRIASNPACKLVLILWDQPGGKGSSWRHEIEEITIETLMMFRDRRRSE
jgi:hypothetical protein